MVWSTAQSALYKAVDDYNSRENKSENYTENRPQKEPEIHAENCSENSSKKYTENSSKKCCQNCPKIDPFSRIFSDRDLMLIAGLILILLNEKADQKLIFALLFVLLS